MKRSTVIFGTVLAVALAGCSPGGGGMEPEPAGPVATTVTVMPASVELVEGGSTVGLTAQVLDQHGDPMNAAPVNWSSNATSVASVHAQSGLVTSGIPGVAQITARAGSASGSAQVTVVAPSVASVEFFGPNRVKVGAAAPSFSVAARLADGSIVTRPVTWSVTGPGAAIDQSGNLATTQAGDLRVSATIDGRLWVGPLVNAYDWTFFTTSDLLVAVLPSHISISNKFGTTAYPELTITCRRSDSFFAVWVDTLAFVTASGNVAYRLDDGPLVEDVWFEIQNFRVLAHSGNAAVRKGFAGSLVTTDDFFFLFPEFNTAGIREIVLFQPVGLQPHLNALLAACPIDYLAPPLAVSAPVDLVEDVRRVLGR